MTNEYPNNKLQNEIGKALVCILLRSFLVKQQINYFETEAQSDEAYEAIKDMPEKAGLDQNSGDLVTWENTRQLLILSCKKCLEILGDS